MIQRIKMKTLRNDQQTEVILNYMRAGHSITPIDALRLFGCQRLAARIYDIKKQGWGIISKKVNVNNAIFSSYSLGEKRVEKKTENQLNLF